MISILELPLSPCAVLSLHAGDVVRLNGTLYTARDAAHARFIALLESGAPLPIEKGSCVYYAGPCPAAPGEVVGPCGPTTSKRMDVYTPALIDYGITAFIGKGSRCRSVLAHMRGRAVYFAATGGAGMLYASCVTACRTAAFPELGAEAVYALTVRDFPAIVAADAHGGCLYQTEDWIIG